MLGQRSMNLLQDLKLAHYRTGIMNVMPLFPEYRPFANSFGNFPSNVHHHRRHRRHHHCQNVGNYGQKEKTVF